MELPRAAFRRLRDLVAQVPEDRLGTWTAFRAREAFRPSDAGGADLPQGFALVEEEFRVEVATLNHGIPCFAFTLQERRQVHVRPDGLGRLGLAVGPWLTTAQHTVQRSEADGHP